MEKNSERKEREKKEKVERMWWEKGKEEGSGIAKAEEWK